jgi:hypothetical protein
MELIHRQLCERDIFKHQQESYQYQINSLENLASKQRIFRIVKEQHGFLCGRAIERLLCATHRRSKQSQHRTRAFLKRAVMKRLVEPAGIEPATSCLQSRRSPS